MEKKYVLIVDDDPDTVETVGMMLESKGYEVGKAYDGIEGEESIRERIPDVLVLDIMMPRKNGYVLCAELKKKKGNKGHSHHTTHGCRRIDAEDHLVTCRCNVHGSR